MAQKFVKVTGLNKVFAKSENNYNFSTILEAVANIVNENSILFVTIDNVDEMNYPNLYKEGEKYIFAKSTLYNCNNTEYDDTEIKEEIEEIQSKLFELDNFIPEEIKPSTTNFIVGETYSIKNAFQRTTNLFAGYWNKIQEIFGLIPLQATTTNQLADKDFVNSTVATNAANFRGNWATQAAVPTNVNLYPEDYTGNRKPTNNDYMVIQDASDYIGTFDTEFFIQKAVKGNHDIKVIIDGKTTTITPTVGMTFGIDDCLKITSITNYVYIAANKEIMFNGVVKQPNTDLIIWNRWDDIPPASSIKVGVQGVYTGMWRFIYIGDWNTLGKNGWKPQYRVGSTFTASQQAAIDSGVTSDKVAKYDSYESEIDSLRTDKLDKVYSSGKKLYGVAEDGSQIIYTAGEGIELTDDGKITNTCVGEAIWGNITGEIDNQLDLKNKLDNKQNKLTAGSNIQIENDIISATDTIYDDTEVRELIANNTQAIENEADSREEADTNLQTQITENINDIVILHNLINILQAKVLELERSKINKFVYVTSEIEDNMITIPVSTHNCGTSPAISIYYDDEAISTANSIDDLGNITIRFEEMFTIEDGKQIKIIIQG